MGWRVETATREKDKLSVTALLPNSSSRDVERARSVLEEHFPIDLDGLIELALLRKEEITGWCDRFQIELQASIDSDSLAKQARQQAESGRT